MKPGYFSFKSKLDIIATLILVCFFLSTNILGAEQSENGFIMLNLHWSGDRLSLNSFKEVKGLFKKQKRILKDQSFFFKVISENDENILTDYFEIPIKLKYDSCDQVLGEMEGGVITRRGVDFVIRVPNYDHVKEIRLFKRNSMLPMEAKINQSMEDNITFLGAVSLRSF